LLSSYATLIAEFRQARAHLTFVEISGNWPGRSRRAGLLPAGSRGFQPRRSLDKSAMRQTSTPIISDFLGRATVSVAPVGDSPTESSGKGQTVFVRN
jgi:hypothetical protein